MPNNRATRTVILWTSIMVVIGLAWLGFAYSLAPRVLVHAYHGESLSIVNRLINGQASHTVGEYLVDWRRLANKLTFALVVLDVFTFLAVLGWVTRDVATLDSAAKVSMPKRRLVVAYALGAIIFGGALADLVRDTEHWPFSQYPMFSEVQAAQTFSMLRLYGIPQQSPQAEVPLDSNLYLQPFDNSRLPPALEHAARENRLDEAMENCLTRYEALRREGRHDGPALVGMRLYRLTWTLQSSADNVDRPDRKELLAEVHGSPKGSD